jgi:hypothetical protein
MDIGQREGFPNYIQSAAEKTGLSEEVVSVRLLPSTVPKHCSLFLGHSGLDESMFPEDLSFHDSDAIVNRIGAAGKSFAIRVILPIPSHTPLPVQVMMERLIG